MSLEDTAAPGQAALRAGRWEEAVAAFEESLSARETAEALDGLGEALWWLCDARSSVRHRERAFVMYREAGNVEAACRTAVNLCITYLVNLGNPAAASGWLARAERVIDTTDDSPMQGWLWLMHGFMEPDPRRARETFERAIDRARASDDVDLELVGLADLGLSLVRSGRAPEGMALLDEAMAGTLGGEYKSLDTVVYTSCSMLAACSHVGDLERASQWCRVADEFMQEYSCPFLFARCRVHYGSVLLAKGEWDHAEVELEAALRMSKDADTASESEALVHLADLRARRGQFEEAEALLEDFPDAMIPLPSAALQIARGEPAVAAALLERRLEQLDEAHPEAVPTLAMLVDAHVACGDDDAALEAWARLDAIARTRGDAHPAALSALAAARIAGAKGDADAEVAHLEEALSRFAALDLPLETARTRHALARALVATRPEVAVAEAGKALRSFEELGAHADVNATAAFLRAHGGSTRTGPRSVDVLTKREKEVLELVGRGLSNPEIATRLFISRKTAAHHVSNLLAKLGLRNRAEAVAYFARSSATGSMLGTHRGSVAP